MNYGYPKSQIMDIQNSAWLLDIHKSIFGYPKNELWISKNQFMDILKYIFGYPKIILDIHNYFVIS